MTLEKILYTDGRLGVRLSAPGGFGTASYAKR